MEKIINKKQCYSCAYRNTIPGDAHSRCCFNFQKAGIDMPKGNLHGIRMGWYMFPFNYDPTWMIEECKAYNKIANNELIKKSTGLEDLMSILGKRF